jgi:hypothetical protein
MRTMRSLWAVLMAAMLAAAGRGSAQGVAATASVGAAAAWSWSDPVRVPEKNPGAINSTLNENNPAVSADGRTLYFVRGMNTIWASEWDDASQAWGDPAPLGPCINDGSANNAPAPSPDGRAFFFSSNRLGTFDLFIARRSVDAADACGWEDPVPLGGDVNTALRETGPEPVLAAEEGITYLYFGRQEADGVFRIFTVPMARDGTVLGPVERVDELSPVNQQSGIREAAVGPSLSMDRLEIFFHSTRDGSPTDLFTATRRDVSEPWSTPVKLEPPLNSSAGDVQPNLSRDGRVLLFVSNRAGSQGTDIWMSTRSPAPPR